MSAGRLEIQYVTGSFSPSGHWAISPARLKRYETEHEWLTSVRLPPYAPDLNPVEAVWSLVRRAMANTAFDTPDDLDRTLRRELRRIQLRPHRPTDPTLKTSVTKPY
ncbi:transposase [Streptomyces sp. NPDC007088]|uniref:transposase n=1 Tax=Streptomyces sp. NPDC007088 TaxID=3364773 RepID=UPI00367BF8B5